jgi:hypothetical protein
MGNMGYPVITRLGINQFWYKHWYSDKTLYSNKIQQLNLIETLLTFYLKHGLDYKSNFFIHEYWYKSSKFNYRSDVFNYQLKNYFRRYFYTHSTLSIEHNYLLRNSTQEYFPMRTWVLQYHNWLVFSIQWFKPAKTKHDNLYTRSVSFVGGIHKKNINKNLLTNRSKLFLIFMLRNFKKSRTRYMF